MGGDLSSQYVKLELESVKGQFLVESPNDYPTIAVLSFSSDEQLKFLYSVAKPLFEEFEQRDITGAVLDFSQYQDGKHGWIPYIMGLFDGHSPETGGLETRYVDVDKSYLGFFDSTEPKIVDSVEEAVESLARVMV